MGKIFCFAVSPPKEEILLCRKISLDPYSGSDPNRDQERKLPVREKYSSDSDYRSWTFPLRGKCFRRAEIQLQSSWKTPRRGNINSYIVGSRNAFTFLKGEPSGRKRFWKPSWETIVSSNLTTFVLFSSRSEESPHRRWGEKTKGRKFHRRYKRSLIFWKSISSIT